MDGINTHEICPVEQEPNWIKRLSAKEIASTPPVFQKVLGEVSKNLDNFRTEREEADRIAVVISAYDARDLLPNTLAEISEQLKELGLQGEIFVVLNNGGGNTGEFINSKMEEEQLKTIADKIGVGEIVFGRTEKLSGQLASDSKKTPRSIVLDRDILQKSGIRLVVIEQQSEPDNAGKIRALRDIYEFLRRYNQEKGYCPRYLLAADAETRLRPVDVKSKRKKIIIEQNSGLSHMIDLSDDGKKMVGAKLQFVPYDQNGNPNWREKTPSMQEAISIMHGMRGYKWLPGGATLGGFRYMVSILSAVSRELPGTRIEDVLTTVLARTLDIETIVDNQVIHTNRCPSEDQKKEVFLQMERWLKGYEGLRSLAGDQLTRKVISNDIVKIIAHPLVELAKGKKVNVPHLLKGLLPYIRANKLARSGPDDFEEGSGTFR